MVTNNHTNPIAQNIITKTIMIILVLLLGINNIMLIKWNNYKHKLYYKLLNNNNQVALSTV